MSNSTKTKTTLTAAALWLTAALQGFAYNNLWLKCDAYPSGAGKVYISSYMIEEGEPVGKYAPSMEIKEARQFNDAFVTTEAAAGYKLAGFARDNGNQTFDNGVDEQVRVNEVTGAFSAVLDEEYFDAVNGSTTQAQHEAEEALLDLTEPTDYIFAVFTQGDVAHTNPDDTDMGYVVSSKLDNAIGETVIFTAIADKKHHFVSWTNSAGATVGSKPTLSVTVKGGETYIAHFATGDAIQGIPQDEARRQETFDLLGRTTQAIQPGIYVRKGKKVVK